MDAEGHGVGNRVIDVDKFDLKASGLNDVSGLMGDQLDRVGQAVLLQLQTDQAVGEGRPMHRRVDGLQYVGQGTDVILMPVGDEEAVQLLLMIDQIGHVGDHKIHAVHIVFGEAESAVYDNHILAVFQNGDILPDFI